MDSIVSTLPHHTTPHQMMSVEDGSPTGPEVREGQRLAYSGIKSQAPDGAAFGAIYTDDGGLWLYPADHMVYCNPPGAAQHRLCCGVVVWQGILAPAPAQQPLEERRLPPTRPLYSLSRPCSLYTQGGLHICNRGGVRVQGEL